MTDITAVVQTLVASGAALRKAGVLRVRLGDVEVEFAPWAERTVGGGVQEVVLDPEDDPITYQGLPGVPSYGRRPKD